MELDEQPIYNLVEGVQPFNVVYFEVTRLIKTLNTNSVELRYIYEDALWNR